jgi:signal transduction histidine kinase
MKYTFLLSFLACFIKIGYTQNKTFATFRDYLIPAAYSDSLKKVKNNGLLNPHSRQNLHLLIAIELGKQNWDEPIAIQNIQQIGQMAAGQKSQMGLAMTYLILGRHYTFVKEDSLSYDYLTKAEKIFTKNKDTTGMLYCYRQLRLSVHENYIDLAKQYFNKLIALSTKSGNPVDKYFYYLSILSADPYFEKQPTEDQLSDAFNKAIEMIDRYSYCEFMRRNIYHNLQQGYVYLNKYDKALDVALQTIRHPKIKADFMDYQNLGRAYIRVKKFDEAIVALEKAGKEIKTADPTNYRRQRNIYKLLKTAYYNVGNWKAGVKADEEYDRLHEIIIESDRSLAMFHLKEKYSFTEKEAELKRISLEKQVAESRNKLLKAQYDAEKREATLKNLALENQANESNTKLLRTQIDINKKESTIQLAESQKQLLFGSLLVALGLIGIILIFSIKLKKTNTKLLELQQSRDKFYTILAHDLRSPLNTLNNLGTLLNHLIREGKTRELDKVVRQIESMSEQSNLLLNNLFEWGKSQYFTNEPAATPDTFDAVPFLQMVCNYYLPFAEAKEVTLATSFPTSLLLKADRKGFEMAVRNLLDNALKHTSGGGKITVSGRSGDEGNPRSSILIADTGEGIAPEQLHSLQQVFAGKIKPEVGVNGVGLGMVLVYHFVKRNKVKLHITGELGSGVCFSMVWEA